MRAIVAPAYFEYTTKVTATIGPPDGVIFQAFAHVERTSDRTDAAEMVDEQKDDGARRNHYFENPFPIAPDLFLGRTGTPVPDANADAFHVGLDDGVDHPMKTIAVVASSQAHYKVRSLGMEDLPNCASAIHLKLDPIKDPLTYNLRDLWVESETSRICKAVAVWRGRVDYTRVLASITLDLDEHGFINHYTTLVSGHTLLFLGPIVSVRQDAAFANLQAVDEARFLDRSKSVR